jgi:CubicO group peptidase (beta-lactamase class C family)
MSSWDDFLRYINGAGAELFDKPGKHYFYNNDMYECLGLIVEKASNMKFDEYIRQHIFHPLKMTRSTYLKDEFENDPDTIIGYVPSKEGQSLVGVPPPLSRLFFAAGGVYASVREMQNYLIALLNDGTFNGTQLIQKPSLEQMWTPHIKIPEETRGLQGDAGYGYGWMIEKDFLGQTLIQHTGNVGFSSAVVAILPDQKIGVAVGMNSVPGIYSLLARGLLAALLGKDMSQAVPILAVQERLKLITGKYTNYSGIGVEILLQGSVLVAKLDPISIYPAITYPLAPDNLDELKFYVPVVFPNQKMSVQFFIDKKTGKTHFTIDRYYFHKVS